MKNMTKLRSRRLLLVAGLLWLWPTAGLRAQEVGAEEPIQTAVKCDTIRMTWEAEAGEWKAISFMGDSGAWYRVDWGDGSVRFVCADSLEMTLNHGYRVADRYEVLLHGVIDRPVFLDSNYIEKAFGLELSMVYVEGGTFMMGAMSEQGSAAASNERPVHSVTLDDFYVGQFEVTQGQWEAVMGTTVEQQRDKTDPSGQLYGVGDNYPMYYVNWEEAQEFCAKLSQKTGKTYRLPTEAEWEYAARGGIYSDGSKYAGSNAVGEVAWCYANSFALGLGHSDFGTHPVGRKQSNGLVLYDMSGNVAEWCLDRYDENYYSESPVVNPQGPLDGAYRVRRGGSWNSYATCCRVSYRYNFSPGGLNFCIGFRVVCIP